MYQKNVESWKKFSKTRRARTKQKLQVILSTLTFSGTANNKIFKNARCFACEISAVTSPLKQALRTKNIRLKNNLITLSQIIYCVVASYPLIACTTNHILTQGH